MKSRLLRMFAIVALLVGVGAQPDRLYRLMASGPCTCFGEFVVYDESDNFVAEGGSWSGGYVTANNVVDCAANHCQNWASTVGPAQCTAYNLNGTGARVEHSWWWWYNATDSGNVPQTHYCY